MTTPKQNQPECIVCIEDIEKFLSKHPIGTVWTVVGKYSAVQYRITRCDKEGVWAVRMPDLRAHRVTRLPVPIGHDNLLHAVVKTVQWGN